MNEVRRIGITLFMSSPLQREAWAILSAIPARQRTEMICLALCREHERSEVLRIVREAVRDELGGAVTAQTGTKEEQTNAGNVGDDVLGFLRSLQCDGGDNV